MKKNHHSIITNSSVYHRPIFSCIFVLSITKKAFKKARIESYKKKTNLGIEPKTNKWRRSTYYDNNFMEGQFGDARNKLKSHHI